MKNDNDSLKRRNFLTNLTKVVGGIGAVFALIPFLSTMSPSEKTKMAGAPIEIDISAITPGTFKIVEWRGKPVWVVHRTAEMLDIIDGKVDYLADPESSTEMQPIYAQNKYRSVKPEFLVLVGVCTHLGCVPLGQKVGEVRGEYDGWFCPCHGSHYDSSGRIRKGPAPTNLEIPPYAFLSDDVIKIG